MDTAANSPASLLAFAREHILGTTMTVTRGRKVAVGTEGVVRWVGVNHRLSLRVGLAVEGSSGLVFVDASNCTR